VTWEAIEHQGPGLYDQQYLDYLKQLVQLAAAHDLNVFIDPHQDVWSRYSGGSGAPLWTFEVAGLDPRQFSATGAALVHNVEGDPLAKMIWYTNNSKLAAATMWTLFFAGNDFAPQLKVAVAEGGESLPIQDYLQQHFNAAMERVAIALQGMPNVIGFEYINEPASGYIGLEDLTAPFTQALFGDTPTPAQGMFLAAGYPQTVTTAYVGLLDIEQGEPRLLNSEQAVAWVDNKTGAATAGVWQQHGVWGLDQQGRPAIKKPHYFSQINGRPVDFSSDYLKPAIEQYKARIRAVDADWTLFVSPSLFPNYTPLPVWDLDERDNMVNAKHWYDDVTLAKKQFMPYVGLNTETNELQFGVKKVREFIEKMLGESQQETQHALGNAPTLIGETGIPYDMNDRQAYRDGDFSEQEKAADRVFNALEKNLLHYTWWNYTADNNNERGDQWNGEDLSIFSRDQQLNKSDVNSGGRALSAIVRPYPYKVAGKIIEYRFDRLSGEFLLRYQADKNITAPTEIFLPDFHYGKGYIAFSHSGEFRRQQKNSRLMFYPEKYDQEQVIVVRPARR
jgi:aryl-phospho-beta-D-glucosidase BglC (GH1 family)